MIAGPGFCRGIKQLIAVKGNKAALLVIHLCSIEVRMSLEQDDMQRVCIPPQLHKTDHIWAV